MTEQGNVHEKTDLPEMPLLLFLSFQPFVILGNYYLGTIQTGLIIKVAKLIVHYFLVMPKLLSLPAVV